MTTDITNNLKRFSFNIIVVQILALLVLVIAVVAMNGYMKHKVAEQMLLAAQNDFLTGDFRQAILRMESANKDHFTAMGYFKNGKRIFNIPSNIDSSLFSQKNLLRVMQNARVVKTISFGNPNVESLGELNFIYDRFEFLPYGFMLWGLLLSLTFPIWFRAKSRLIRDYNKEIIFQEQKSKAQIAEQVAHDIKSPLAALSVLQQDLQELPEEKRLLLRSAVQRIHDIANDLSKKKNPENHQSHNQDASSTQENQETQSTQLLSSIIDTLVSEKRLQFRSKINTVIEADLGSESYGLFAKVQQREFKRLLSNLINNAVEAMGDNGNKVGLTLKPDETDKIRITISDNGKGIPPEILPKLMQRGETHGKSGGTGLGLYHARMTIQSWGGDVCLESEVGKGTIVTISLPQDPAPAWFVPKLEIANGATVIIVDDDNSIHQIWRGRLEKFAKDNNVTVKHFSTPDELLNAYRLLPVANRFERLNQAHDHLGQSDENSSHEMLKQDRVIGDQRKAIGDLILCDHEFLGQEKTGLDVIEELGLSKNTILVTSHFEELKIRERCQKLGVQLIPKNLAGFVPIIHPHPTNSTRHDISPSPSLTVREGEGDAGSSCTPGGERVGYDAILIDDDQLVHMNWKIAAKKQNRILRTFTDPTEFQNVMTDLDKSTPIYVDSNLADGIKGEDVAYELKAKGFSNLYLATGFDRSNFPDMSWIQDVVGKSPPW